MRLSETETICMILLLCEKYEPNISYGTRSFSQDDQLVPESAPKK